MGGHQEGVVLASGKTAADRLTARMQKEPGRGEGSRWADHSLSRLTQCGDIRAASR